METLPQNAGGAGEDATHALMHPTHGEEKAERVVIMVTDDCRSIKEGEVLLGTSTDLQDDDTFS